MRGFVILALIILAGCSSSPPKKDSSINPDIAPDVAARVASWNQLIEDGRHWSDERRLQAANDFINQLVFVDDIQHWGQEDYWATPLQTIVTGGGDCEDFSLAKYFTLTGMGMGEEKLRLTYVKALKLEQAHMVVSYYPTIKSVPLVLDNLNTRILPATQRDDLYPVYSFNGKGLWITRKDYDLERANDAERISLWQKLLKKMELEAARQQDRICHYQYHDLPEDEASARCR